MNEPLHARIKNDLLALFHNREFKDFLEMHMANLRKASIQQGILIDVDEVQKNRANRNFSMLCNICGISYELHWLTMRVNGLKFNTDFHPNIGDLYQVNREYLDFLISSFIESKAEV